MSCPEENVLLDFIRGELDEQAREAVELHIDGCASCGQILAELARFERDSDGYVEATLGPPSGGEADEADESPLPPLPRRLPPPKLSQGSTLGPYVVLDQIGAGGMGVVYSAYDPRLDRKIALKLLLGSPGGSLPKEQAELRTRLQREAQAMARLSHSNVITVHDVGEVDGQLFLAMEFIDGGTLKDWLKDGPHSWQEVLAMFVAAGSGLAAAHAAGLVHRDFKPDNVLLGQDGRVLVTDFGLARPMAGRTDAFLSVPAMAKLPVMAEQLTMTGELVGTPAYMAPEQLSGKRSDALGDQFSFCVAMFEALYGERPFEGKLLGELITNVTSGTVRATRRDNQVPRWIRKAILRGLQPNPEDRFPDMHELLAALGGDPSTRWRTIAAIGLPAALLAVGLWAYAADDRDPVEYCDDLDHHFVGIWDAPRRSALEQTFERSGAPFATRSWETTETYLDAFADSWLHLQGEACRAEVSGELPASVLSLRMSCLERHRQAFGALVEVLGGADRDVLERAVEAASRLPEPSTCLNVERVSAEMAELGNDAQRRERADLEVALARARALYQVARFTAAEEVAADVAGRARQTKDTWIVADALALQADIEQGLGERDDAESHYQDAFARAIEADHPRVMVEVATGLLWMTERFEGRPSGTRRWLDRGQAALQRLDGDADLETRLYNAAGRAFLLEGQYDAAEQHLRHSLRVGQDALGPDHPALAEPLSGLGQLMTAQGKYDRAQPILERVLQMAEREYGADHPNVGTAAENLAVLLARRGELGPALEQFERALAIKAARLAPDHPKVALSHRNIAEALLRLGRPQEALEHAEAAASALGESKRANAADRLANDLLMAAVLRDLDRLDEALEHARRAATDTGTTQGKTSLAYARSALVVAGILRETGAAEAAIDWAESALTIARATDPPSPTDLVRALHELARVELAAGRGPHPGLDHATEALELADRSALTEPEELARVRLTLAQCLRASGEQPDRARALAVQALEQLPENDADATRARALLDAIPPA